MAEVSRRNRVYIPTQDTQTRISKVAKWLTVGKKTSLLLYGEFGTGKSTLARAIFLLISTLNPSDVVRHTTARELAKLAAEKDENFEVLKKAKMLIIDELGREPIEVVNYGTRFSPALEVLEYRYDKQLFTIITSNATDANLKEIYGEHITERFDENYDKLNFDFKSFRKC